MSAFIKALDSSKRIIVVNIQKFLDLKEAIDVSGTKLKQMRMENHTAYSYRVPTNSIEKRQT